MIFKLILHSIIKVQHILKSECLWIPQEIMFRELWVGYRVGSGIDFGCSGSKIPDPTQPYYTLDQQVICVAICISCGCSIKCAFLSTIMSNILYFLSRSIGIETADQSFMRSWEPTALFFLSKEEPLNPFVVDTLNNTSIQWTRSGPNVPNGIVVMFAWS